MTSDFNLNRGLIDGTVSEIGENGDLRCINFDIDRVLMIRVYHGSGIVGMI